MRRLAVTQPVRRVPDNSNSNSNSDSNSDSNGSTDTNSNHNRNNICTSHSNISKSHSDRNANGSCHIFMPGGLLRNAHARSGHRKRSLEPWPRAEHGLCMLPRERNGFRVGFKKSGGNRGVLWGLGKGILGSLDYSSCEDGVGGYVS